MPETNKCRTCGGTGEILSMRSWFKSDGYARSRCGICAGSGQSSYQPDTAYARFQATARLECSSV